MKVLEVAYRTSWYVEDEKQEAEAMQRLSVADEYADKLLAMDFSTGSFKDWILIKDLQYALFYIEKLKNSFYVFDSIIMIKEARFYEFPLCEPAQQ